MEEERQKNTAILKPNSTNECTKEQFKVAKEILKQGILNRHKQWHSELRAIMDCPYNDVKGNPFDRTVQICELTRDWYKEPERMEYWYRRSAILMGIVELIYGGFFSR